VLRERSRYTQGGVSNNDFVVVVSVISAAANMAICLWFFARIKRRLDSLDRSGLEVNPRIADHSEEYWI
jgi:hypothetical protein